MQITLEQDDLLAAVNMFIKDKMPNYVLDTADIVIKTNPQKKLTRAEITFPADAFSEDDLGPIDLLGMQYTDDHAVDSDEIALIDAVKTIEDQPKVSFDEDETIETGPMTPPWEQQEDQEKAIIEAFGDDDTVHTKDLDTKSEPTDEDILAQGTKAYQFEDTTELVHDAGQIEVPEEFHNINDETPPWEEEAKVDLENFEEAEPNDPVTPVEDLILAEPEISDDEDLFKID